MFKYVECLKHDVLYMFKMGKERKTCFKMYLK